MIMQIHLLSDSGEPFLASVIEICRGILAGVEKPVVAYLPAASVSDTYFALAIEALRPLGDVILLDADRDPLDQMTETLERASALFMPGGNTYLLSQRLHGTGLFGAIRERARDGLALVGVSAGSVMCGQSVLTTNDMNCCACTDFDGLGLVPYNLNVHYPDADGPARDLRIGRLWEVHHFFETPVIMLEDSAYLRVDAAGSTLVRGAAWRLEPGQEEPSRIRPGEVWSA